VAAGPMDQFKIKPIVEGPQIGPIDTTFTNSSLWMVMGVIAVVLFLVMGLRKQLIPGRMQSMGELSYEFIANMVRDTIGPEGMKFFPFIFTLFFFVLAANLLGMNPYGFTTTSHIAVTVALSIFTILLVVAFGIYKNGLSFFKLFAPSGLPLPMYLIIIPIEIISFLSRPLSLAVRLFANMLAGHVMLKVFAIFAAFLAAKGGVMSLGVILPVLGTTALVALEFLVAALQAFVFAILACIYLHDAYHPVH